MYCQTDVRMIQQTDVIIIGSGCAAWWVSLYLALRGIASVILDTSPPGAFSSTANQGWLQSGGWHMMVGNDLPTAQACWNGYLWIRSHYPEVIRPGIACYFLLPEEEDLEQGLARCRQARIPVDPVSIDEVKAREPILKESPLGHALQMPDVAVDTRRLLQIVA